VSLICIVASKLLFMCAGAQDRFAALESLASVPQPKALLRELHGRLVSAAAAAGVPATLAMDVALAEALLGREAANSFGVRDTRAQICVCGLRVVPELQARCRGWCS